MNLLEIIYAIREKLKAYTDDTRYTDDFLYFEFKNTTNTLIRQEYNQLQRTIDSEMLKTICLELEQVDASECPECTISEDCEVVRTVKKLPKYIELHNRNSITRVAPIGVMNRPINFTSRNRVTYIGEESYEKNQIYAFKHDNGHMYLKSKNPFFNTLEYITVTGLPEDPLQLKEYSCDSSGTICFSENEKYPINSWMANTAIDMIVSKLANLKQIPEDRTNDAKENV